MVIGRIDFIITLLTKIPPIYNSMRITLVSMIGKDPDNFSNLLNVLLTIPLLLLSCLVGALYQHVTDYIDLIGSLTSIFIMFLIPGLLYLKSNDYPKTHWKNITTIILISLFSVICLISAIFTIKDIIDKA
jgi:amino acid permease